MRFTRLTALLALFGLALGPMAVRAESPSLEGARSALEVTDRRIERAEAALSNSRDDQARSELDIAWDLQSRARGAFSAAQPAWVEGLALEARGYVARAPAVTQGLPGPDRVQAELERSREILGLAAQRLHECRDARAQAMLRVAFEMEDRAENAAHAGRYLGALQLTRGARERGLRALGLCRLQDDVQGAAQRALQRTDRVLARARTLLLDPGGRRGPAPEQARAALRRAGELQDDAAREFRGEHYPTSLRLTLRARTLAQRAARAAAARAF
jgi:hypothetical protein